MRADVRCKKMYKFYWCGCDENALIPAVRRLFVKFPNRCEVFTDMFSDFAICTADTYMNNLDLELPTHGAWRQPEKS